MKKITALLLVVMLLVSAFSMSAFAAVEDYNEDCATIVKETVRKGTPTIDGKLDAIYTQSMTVKLHGPAAGYSLQNGGEDITASATVYSLYDNNYVYIFFDVTDATFMQNDAEYLNDHPHPHLNDAVEFRIGDDLEDHFTPYNGKNDAHHLYYVDGHGDRFSCYDDSMRYENEETGEVLNDFDRAKSAVIFDAAKGKYTVEVAIPTIKSFQKGEMIQFNFQIDDLQDEMEKFAAIGFATKPTGLVDLYCGDPVDGYVESNDQPVVDAPEVKDPEPVVTPEPEVKDPEPVVTPEPEVKDPVDTPDEPVDTPDEPVEGTDEPVEGTDEPVEGTDEPVEGTDEPVEGTDEPVEGTDEPVVTPEEPTETPEEPVVDEEPAEEGSNLGLIIGIALAVIVVVAVVVVVAKKKK